MFDTSLINDSVQTLESFLGELCGFDVFSMFQFLRIPLFWHLL